MSEQAVSRIDAEMPDPAAAQGPTVSPLAQRIKRDILARLYKSGEWLRLNELEARYGVSRAEVRKALSTLATLRTLEHVENHGYRVVMFDRDLDRAYRETRFVLEVANVEAFFSAGDLARLADLREKARHFEWSIENLTYGEVDLANHDFHRAMARLSGNPIMARTIDELREVILPSGNHPWATIRGFRTSSAEHFDMIDQIASRDLEGFRLTLRNHMFRWAEMDSDSAQT
ncbi:GntR family transcriptional regulator [Marinovum sp.]|uniref:GntR family transcriptional regulator n=1 Tax=Marinovum sp. TaxID=2024839 RepID=UPI002B27B56D|nr:GntR family transcriptional regulator [Marinovum sp.]